MQINPTSRSASGFDAFFGADSSSGSGFFDVMQDAISSVSDGDNVSASNALAESNQPLVESPYSRHTTDGVTYTLAEVTFTKNELAELRQQLIKEGAPEETLRQFDVLAGQPDGATLAQVMASLMANPNAGKFSDDDAHAITALLGQIDPSGTLAEDALGFMSQGNGEAALTLIKNALGKMAADQTIDIDPSALVALGRGLGLNQGTMNNMVGLLGGQSVRLNGAQMGALLEPAASQFITDAANAQKLEAALDKTLRPIISKARDRMEKEAQASQRESRRVQQSKILIDRTVQKASRETLEETVSGQTAAEDGKASGMVGKAGVNRAEAAQISAPGQASAKNGHIKAGQNLDGNEAGVAENAKAALNQTVRKQPGEFENSGQESDNGSKDKSNAWQDLLGKIETRPSPGGASPNASSFVYSMLQGATTIQDAESAITRLVNQQPQLAQQVVNQVEQGMLTAMRDGATRLDLQLHPAELGPLSITLIARNGEVTAQLKSERTETAELLTRQLDMIRVNLEQQGLKIDKIEVQLQNQPDNSQNAFADLQQHNSYQEENMRRQTLNRLRNLASLRDDDGNPSLAQGLHENGQSARYADNALHVVA